MTFTVKLIASVKKHPIIFDVSDENYKNIHARDKVWKEIGLDLNEKGEDVKRKWRNLKDSYIKYLRSTKTKTGHSRKSYHRWRWAREMEYFRPFLELAKTSSSFAGIRDNDVHDEKTDMRRTENVRFGNENDQTTEDKSTASCSVDTVKSSPVSSSSRKRKSKAVDTDESSSSFKVIEHLDNKYNHKVINDPIDLIFQGYALTVKSFSPERQAYVKLQIAELMNQQEVEHLYEKRRSMRFAARNNFPDLSTRSLENQSAGSSLSTDRDEWDCMDT